MMMMMPPAGARLGRRRPPSPAGYGRTLIPHRYNTFVPGCFTFGTSERVGHTHRVQCLPVGRPVLVTVVAVRRLLQVWCMVYRVGCRTPCTLRPAPYTLHLTYTPRLIVCSV